MSKIICASEISASAFSVLVFARVFRLLRFLWFGLFRFRDLGHRAFRRDLVAVSADTSTPWGAARDGRINTLQDPHRQLRSYKGEEA